MPNVLSLNTEKRSHVSSNALHDVGYFRTLLLTIPLYWPFINRQEPNIHKVFCI